MKSLSFRFSANYIICIFFCIAFACQSGSRTDEELKEHANKLAQEYIIADTHVDIPYRLEAKMEDISVRTEGGDFDYPRAKEGGLNAPFMSIFVPAGYQHPDSSAFAFGNKMIDIVEKIVSDSPDKFAVAKSVADVKAQFAEGKISLPMGMENGAPVEGKLENLKHFYDRGIRYITLTHGRNNHICDSSYDEEQKWNGLSPFGREVVAEMNRLGIMVDISHVSDSTFYQVMEISKAPAIASHSSCRFFTPDFERNMNDDMIKLLAKNGGVIQINYGSSFLRGDIREKSDSVRAHIRKYLRENNLKRDDEKAREYTKKYRMEQGMYADVKDVVAHIDHVVQLAGIDHVGLGSDFDGVGDSLPTGLKDASYLPNLIYELLKKGYSDEDIKKICSGNTFRVWSEVERIAKELQVGT